MKTFFYALFCFFSLPAFAVSFDSVYEAKGLNMTLLSADMSIVSDNSSYAIETHSYARGILSLFIDSETIFQTKGLYQKEDLKVLDSVMKNKNDGKIRTTRQNFEEKAGYIDYQSALIELMRLTDEKTQTFLIADGKRDMEVVLTYEGEKDLSLLDSSLSGTAQAYSVRVTVIAGKKKGWFFKRMREAKESPLWLYLQNDESVGGKTLVAGTFDTGILGKLHIIRKELKNVQNK